MKKNKKLLFGFGIFILFFICVTLFFSSHVEVPKNIKIADVTNSITNIHFLVPKGNHFSIFASTISAEHHFSSGHVRVLEGNALIAEFSFVGGCESIQVSPNSCGCGLADFWNTNSTPWTQVIQSQIEYDLQISFDEQPPTMSTIWLHWLQTYKDTEK